DHHRPSLLHPLGHAFLRADVLPADRHGSLPARAEETQRRAGEIPRHARPVADLHRAGAVALSRLSVQRRLSPDVLLHPVGTGLGDDRSGWADLSARLGDHHLWRRPDRRPQPARPHQLAESIVGRPAPARLPSEHAAAPVGCRLSADPWIGVTAVGYALGQVYGWPVERRKKFLLRMGVIACAAFVVLRAGNFYGDPNPWSVQQSAAMTLVAFLNTVKYPPSLIFLLMTLGPALLALRAFEYRTPRVLHPALVFG